MLYEIIDLIIGIIKILIYKCLYSKRLIFKDIPKTNISFKIAIKKNSKLFLGSNFRSRYNISFRIYDKGLISIGDNCFMNDNCSLNCRCGIRIGNNVIMGQNVMIFDHDHDYKDDMNNFLKSNVVIGNNVWIGANVTVLRGVTIGDNCVIGAGSIVKKNIKSNMVAYNKIDLKERNINNE